MKTVVSTSNWRTRKDFEQLKYMQVLAGNNPDYCAFLPNAFANSDKQLQQKMNNNKISFNDEVMQSIKKFVTSLNASGCRQKEENRRSEPY